MSRSNHNYYNLCEREIGKDGFCDFHRPTGRWNREQHQCIPPGEFLTKRGIVRRKPRYPKWSWKQHSAGPPRSIKRIWRRRERSRYRIEMTKPEVLFNGWKWLGGMYQWWS